MNNQTLVIYDFDTLYQILKEIDNYLNFKLINIDKNNLDKQNVFNMDNFLIASNKKINDIDNNIVIDQLPIELAKLVENININFLKKKYNQQSDIYLGPYKLNLNSRKIFNEDKFLNLTEREANIVLFLKNSKKPVNISKLQIEVWGHNSKLETHTVETHIYRLRKKILNVFKDNDFIKSSKTGYIID
jgi:hypothetical protein